MLILPGVSDKHCTLRQITRPRNGIGRCDVIFFLLIGPQTEQVLGWLPLLGLCVRRCEEAVLIDPTEETQIDYESDVGALWGFYRAYPAVVRGVDVTHLEPSSLSVQAAGAERAETSLVGELRQWICLVHQLRKFTAREEVVYRRRNGLVINEGPRAQFRLPLQTHPLLNGSAQFQKTLAYFI